MRNVYRLLLALLYLAGLLVLVHFAREGLDYYLTPLAERPRHPLYWSYKPGGEMGQLFAWTGTAMMVLMLGYTLRKRLPWMRRWGKVAVWLDIHILLGVLGPLFILLHTSFKVGGLVALSFWSMVAVALSGVLGRYLYVRLGQSSVLSPERAHRLRTLFHYWHVLHKPFAAIMYLFLAVHVAVAWMAGYGRAGFGP